MKKPSRKDRGATATTNARLAAETTTGANDLRIDAMPADRMPGGDEEIRPAALNQGRC